MNFLANWRLIVLLGTFIGIGSWITILTLQRNSARSEVLQIKAEAAKAAWEAAEKALQITIADQKQKEASDAQNIAAHVAVAAPVKRLRDQHPASSFVPPAPASSSRPDLACFDRAEYQRIDGEFTRLARQRADEGTTATIDLDSAKLWAHHRMEP